MQDRLPEEALHEDPPSYLKLSILHRDADKSLPPGITAQQESITATFHNPLTGMSSEVCRSTVVFVQESTGTIIRPNQPR